MSEAEGGKIQLRIRKTPYHFSASRGRQALPFLFKHTKFRRIFDVYMIAVLGLFPTSKQKKINWNDHG